MKCGQPPNCRPPGEICDESFGECCPGVPQGKLLCFEGSYGVLRCQEPCCLFGGVACQTNDECCSKQCNPNSNTCDNGFACKVYSEDCQANGECCSNTCTNGKCADCECTPTGGECLTPDDCCGGICAPDPNDGGKLKCNPGGESDGGTPQCTGVGGTCFSNAECCQGLCGGVGEFKSCQDSPCKSIGALCADTGECCGGLACTNGVCSQ
jgi:hypothetical protein